MNLDGLLLLNKPPEMTSHSVVQTVKNRLGASKAGHLGTLDPLATGVFPVCLGKATRLTPFYMKADKCYLTAIRFGYFTTTDDREGERESPVRKVTFSETQLRNLLAQFQGEYEQQPPIYSAKKVRGQPAHRLARKGEKPELATQKVQIYEISLVNFERDVAMIFMHCSSGTYVRSIARDLGQRLRCGAHVRDLTRTKFGQFTLDQTCAPDAPSDVLRASFTPLEEMLPHLPEFVVDAQMSKKIMSGSAIEVNRTFDQEWIRVFSEDKTLLAVAQFESAEKGRRLQPKIVFS